MSFFLGMSVISLMEFCCYGATRAKSIYLERSKNMKVEDNNNVNEDNQDKQERKATPPVDTGGAGAKTGRSKGRVSLAEIKKPTTRE